MYIFYRNVIEDIGFEITYDVQIENACLANEAIKHLNVNPVGMKYSYWPCRMEKFYIDFPSVQIKASSISSNKRCSVILDGCHNGESVQKFVAALKEKYGGESEILLLFGAGAEKCMADMLSSVLEYGDKVLMVQSRHFKSLSEKDLCALAKEVSVYDSKVLKSSTGMLELHFQSLLPPSERVEHGTVQDRLNWAIEYSKRY